MSSQPAVRSRSATAIPADPPSSRQFRLNCRNPQPRSADQSGREAREPGWSSAPRRWPRGMSREGSHRDCTARSCSLLSAHVRDFVREYDIEEGASHLSLGVAPAARKPASVHMSYIFDAAVNGLLGFQRQGLLLQEQPIRPLRLGHESDRFRLPGIRRPLASPGSFCDWCSCRGER